MIHVTAGTDTYGRVKTVSGTPIVTKFAMLQFLPVYPLQSYYFIGTGAVENRGIPFLAAERSVQIVGVPLSTVDRTSVLMAYLRGIFGALAVVGCLAIVPGIMYFTGEHLDDLAMIMTRGLLISLGTGIVGGSLSYAIPLTSRRERDVRRYCAELLGISVDPARIGASWRQMIEEWLGTLPDSEETSRTKTIRHLISKRLKIAESEDARALEFDCEDLLEQLRKTSPE